MAETDRFYDVRSPGHQVARDMGYSGYFGDGGIRAFRASLSPSQVQEWGRRFEEIKSSNPEWVGKVNPFDVEQTTITDVTAANAQNPTLPSNTTVVPITQQVQANELLSGPGAMNADGTNITEAEEIIAPTIDTSVGNATQIDIDGVLHEFDPASGGFVPVKTSEVDPLIAAQGTVQPLATVQGQLTDLYSDFDNGNIPAWAQGAINKAEEVMAARGLQGSSIAGSAIASAIQQQAINIAATDAATYFQMDIANLSNEQQARLTNYQSKQQNMLTDVAIQNAASQFNAANELQVEQFTANLVANLQTQNAAFANNMEQFNVQQQNSIAAQNANNSIQVQLANEQMGLTVRQFNANMENVRETFNKNMAFAIEQSNVQWRRQVNTSNTVAVNAANQVNTQNRFNLSAQAQNNLWQAFRDEAYWLFQSSENAAARNFQSAQAANGYSFAQSQADSSREQSLWTSLGAFASKLL